MNFTILIVAPWYPAGPIKYIAEAFERIGCRVIRIGPTYDDHMGLNWGTDMVVPDRELMRAASLWDLNDFVDWTTKRYQAPDMLLVSEENYKTEIIPQHKIPSALWSFDGWPNNYERADLFQCTANYTNHPLGIDLYPRQEIDPRWQFLPGAAAPWVHRDLGLVREIDFCLLASDYGKRQSICGDLGRRGLWVRSGKAVTSVYVEVYNRSLTTFHNARPGEIKWRFFEAAAMGCINISGHSQLFSWLGYKEWEEYVPIETPLENEWPEIDGIGGLSYVIWMLLKNNLGDARHIADKARSRVLAQDTYYHRCKVILQALGLTHIISDVDREIEITLEGKCKELPS